MSLSRLINKTPLQNEKSNVYEVEEINSYLIQKILQSRFIGEGIYSIEQYSMTDYKEQYLSTPSFDKFPFTTIQKEWNFHEDIKESVLYELILDKPLFMPLDINQFTDLFNSVAKIEHCTVFTQVLICKRQDNFREIAISQYESFLNGTDFPMESKFTIKLQEKCLNVLSKISNFTVKRDPIEEMENKILQNNYRFEGRFVLLESKYQNLFESEMQKIIGKLRLFSELMLKKVGNKKSFIKYVDSREFQADLVNQLLSEQEIYSLLCDKGVDKQTETPKLVHPIKKQSITQSIEESMLLQRAVKLMPLAEKQNKEIDQSKADQVNQALKRVGVIKQNLKVTEIYQGASLLKIQMKIPPDIVYTMIKKRLVDIQAALGNESVSIEIGEKPDTINVFIPLENRDAVYFRSILESKEFNEFRKNHPLPFILGENINGGYMFGCLSNLRHILIAGATGSGKSVSINLIIMCLLLCVPPDELALYLIDPKQVEFSQFNGFPQVRKIITDMKKASELLSSLCAEMENRYEKFAKAGVKTISAYNKSNNDKIPYIVTIVDEYADLVMINAEVEDYIVRLSQKARASGIHLIIATQKPLVDIVTSVLKTNLPSAISFRLKTSSDYMTVFGKGIPYNLLGKGDGVCMLEGQYKEFERFQSSIMTLDEEEEQNVYSELKRLFKDMPINEDELPKEEQPIEKLKRIIATSGELRVTELARLMEMGNNKVHELMKELLDEGWLCKPGRSYEVNVDEEELNRWKDNNE